MGWWVTTSETTPHYSTPSSTHTDTHTNVCTHRHTLIHWRMDFSPSFSGSLSLLQLCTNLMFSHIYICVYSLVCMCCECALHDRIVLYSADAIWWLAADVIRLHFLAAGLLISWTFIIYQPFTFHAHTHTDTHVHTHYQYSSSKLQVVHNAGYTLLI